jgi:PAS domain S-box-containing protein
MIAREKRYTLVQLRELIELLDYPAAVSRGELLLAVNEALLRVLGHPREAMEGRPFMEFLPPEERRRQMAFSLAGKSGDPVAPTSFTLGLSASGERLPFEISVSQVPSADPGDADYTLTSCMVVQEQRAELQLAERLGEISTALMSQRSDEAIRSSAVLAFERAGIWAGFYAVDPGKLRPWLVPSGDAPVADAVYAFDAIYEGRPVFAGGEGDQPALVYVPLRRAGLDEVLLLRGRISTRSASVLKLFGEQLSQAYANARLISDLEQGHQETRILLELTRTTAHSLEMERILGSAADFTVRLLDAFYCFVLLYDDRERVLRAEGGSAAVRHDVPRVSVPVTEGSVSGRAALRRAPVSIDDLDATTEDFNREYKERYSVRSVLAVPMISREELIGVVVVGDQRPRHFDPQQVELAQATAGQLAMSVANAHLYESLLESYAALQETRAEMVKRERLAALGELSAVVAHEVRNPLGVIFNAVGSLRKLVPEGQSQVLLNILSEESDRLNRLVGDLLDFARPPELSKQAEDLGRVIQDALEAAASDPSTASARVQVTSEVEPGLPPVPMDRRQLRQALLNVAINAMQSMPRGGVLSVSARRDGGPPERPLRIDLSDNGPGIAAETLSRIFEPFFTTKAQGTGLGLAVVKRIIEDHRGTVEVHSEVGRGTTFTFRLPLAE